MIDKYRFDLKLLLSRRWLFSLREKYVRNCKIDEKDEKDEGREDFRARRKKYAQTHFQRFCSPLEGWKGVICDNPSRKDDTCN